MIAVIGSLSRLVLRWAMWALDHFYEVGRVGEPIPDGPALFIANHPNSVIDGLVVMRIAGRPVHPLAKASLLEEPLIGHVLKGLKAIPVYRPQDYPGETWRNEGSFEAAVDALRRGDAVLIFPEGLSHSEERLARMKTGAARLAFEAEEAAGWRLGLRVVPVGLTYHRKHAFRGRVAAAVGRPLEVAAWREMRERDEWGAVETLTAAMREALETVTLNLPSREDRALLEVAEALYATEKRLAKPRARPGLAPRLPRLHRFAEALAWLHVTDEEGYRRLVAAVRTYRRRLALLGVSEGDLPERFPPASVVRYTLVQGLVLLVGLPLAAAGTVAWYLPYKSPRVSLAVYRPPYEAVASFKLATALLVFPLTYVFWLAVAWWIAGWPGALAAALALPVAGLAALHWRDRWRSVREDARIFLRSVRRRTLRQQLASRRHTLVAEFEAVNRRWQAERRSRATPR